MFSYTASSPAPLTIQVVYLDCKQFALAEYVILLLFAHESSKYYTQMFDHFSFINIIIFWNDLYKHCRWWSG